MKVLCLFFISGLLWFSEPVTDPSKFPVPPYSKKSLFYIHRNTNPNTVVYEVGTATDNQIDPNEPVRIYWIRYGEKSQQRGLNYLERTFAYGVKCSLVDEKKFLAQFVASKEKSFEVFIDDAGQALAMMVIGGQKAKLTKIFVQVAEDGWWPKVAYVEFFGIDAKTNKPAYEKMLIK
jgi:hypothetical protein